MERSEWLLKMRAHTEALYDLFAPIYWVKFGLEPDPTERDFVSRLLSRLEPKSNLLQAGCGAGRYDAMLADAGHRVMGIDQSEKMLARAREFHPVKRYPQLVYRRLPLQEMEFDAEFDGSTCIEAMEHVFPEDWLGIMQRFSRALKPGGLLYITVEIADLEAVQRSYERGLAQGLPVVHGEVVDELESASSEITANQEGEYPVDRADQSVYHYYPASEQVQNWFSEAGFRVEERGSGGWYEHFLLRTRG